MKKFSKTLVSLFGILFLFCMIGCSSPTSSSGDKNKPASGTTGTEQTGTEDKDKPAATPTDFSKLLTITVEDGTVAVRGTYESKIERVRNVKAEVTFTFKNISDKDIVFGKFDKPTEVESDAFGGRSNNEEIKERPGSPNGADGTYVLKPNAEGNLVVGFEAYGNDKVIGKKTCLKIPLVINGENAELYYVFTIRAADTNKKIKMVLTE